MTSRISRRAFLKGSITVAGSVAATTSVARAAKSITKKEQEPLVTLIDISRCIGCEECVYACQEVNEPKFPEPEKPFPKMFPNRVPVQDWSDKRDVKDRLTPYNWLFIQHAFVDIDGAETELTIPRRCMHCANPPCVKLAPGVLQNRKITGFQGLILICVLAVPNVKVYVPGIYRKDRPAPACISIFYPPLPATVICINVTDAITGWKKVNSLPV